MRYIVTGGIATAIVIGALAVTGGSPSGPVANVWMSTSGNDATCTYASTRIEDPGGGADCLTFTRAYQLANVGDQIYLNAGTYAGETIPYTAGKADGLGHCDWVTNNNIRNTSVDYTGCITFDPKPGDTVTVNGLSINVPYFRVRSMAMPGGVAIGGLAPAGTGLGTCAQHKDHDIVVDGVSVTDGTFYMAADHSLLTNSTINYGNTSLGNEKTAHIRECLEVDGTTVVDRSYMGVIHNTFENLIQTANDGLHLEAIHLEAGQHVLIDRNTFYNNAGHNLSGECQLYDTCHDWLYTNNFFDTICSHQTVVASGGTCTVQGGDGFSCGGQNLIDASMQFNSFLAAAPEYLNLAPEAGCNVSGTMIVAGNIAESVFSSFHCAIYTGGGVSMNNYNVWYAASGTTGIIQCGSTNQTGGPAGFVDSASGDLHIDGTSAANDFVPTTVTGNCPYVDIDAEARPKAANCDAGADER